MCQQKFVNRYNRYNRYIAQKRYPCIRTKCHQAMPSTFQMIVIVVKVSFSFCTSSQLIHCIEDWIKHKGQVVIEDCYSNFFRNICNNGLLEVSISEIFAKVWDNSEELLQFILCVPSPEFFSEDCTLHIFYIKASLTDFRC